MRTNSPRKTYYFNEVKQNEIVQVVNEKLDSAIDRLSEKIDIRAVRNIKQTTLGVIKARSTRVTEITSKNKRKCKKLINDCKRTYRLLRSKTWEKNDLEDVRFHSIKNEIEDDTPIGIDMSHIEHPDSKTIEGVCMIHNEDNKLVPGHWWLQAAARVNKRRILPLTSHVFSHETKDFVSMPRTTFDFLDKLHNHIGNKGIWLFDRGFDSIRLMKKLLGLNVKFIVRLQKHRSVFVKGKKKSLKSILEESKYPFKSLIRMKRKPRLVEFDFREIKISGISEKLWLVFTKSRFGETYILLTDIKVEGLESAIKIIKTYRYRWSVEDFFRVMKQDIGIEKIMVRTLRRINKLIEITLLAYTVSFKILMAGGNLAMSIIEMGGKLGIKGKVEDTVGRILKGLANILIREAFEHHLFRRKSG